MTPDGTLIDTGPLFAMVDPQNQRDQFQRCTTVMLTLPVPLVTTWPCLSEVMYLADASLLALAETAGYTRVFSIDSDFYVYRLADGSALEVVPGPAIAGR